MPSYCSNQDVYNQFPRFVPNQPGSVADSVVTDWLADAAAYIYAQFITRNITLPPPPGSGLSQIQLYILRMLNRESGTRDLAKVLYYSTAGKMMDNFGGGGDEPKTSLTASRFRDGRFSEIEKGAFDVMFSTLGAAGPARHVSITPTIPGSIAGGDQDPHLQTPAQEGLNAIFSLRLPF